MADGNLNQVQCRITAFKIKHMQVLGFTVYAGAEVT